MIDALPGNRSLASFAHRGLARRRDPVGRMLALAATILFYAVLLLLAWRGFIWTPLPGDPAHTAFATVRLLPPAPPPRLRMQDFNVRLIRPRVENAPMPEIVTRPEPSNAPRAALPATAAKQSSIAGGAAAGDAEGAVSGVGTGGSGADMAACMDLAYLEAIKRHVARWYFHPGAAGRAAGVAYVHFVIAKGGHYRELALARSSGNAALDAAAMKTMRDAEPLPIIPDRFHTDRLNGVLPIVYQSGTPLAAEQLGKPPGGC